MCVPDNYDLWKSHDAEQQEWLNKLPKCSECGEPIQSECCYEVEGGLICESCLENNHRKWVDDILDAM